MFMPGMTISSLLVLPMDIGHKQVFFNWYSLAPRQYLSANLVAMYDLNLNVTVAFFIGMAVYVILLILWLVGVEKQPPSA